jgi:hypothetical protein
VFVYVGVFVSVFVFVHVGVRVGVPVYVGLDVGVEVVVNVNVAVITINATWFDCPKFQLAIFCTPVGVIVGGGTGVLVGVTVGDLATHWLMATISTLQY